MAKYYKKGACNSATNIEMVCCNICGENFARTDTLSRHMKRVNPCTRADSHDASSKPEPNPSKTLRIPDDDDDDNDMLRGYKWDQRTTDPVHDERRGNKQAPSTIIFPPDNEKVLQWHDLTENVWFYVDCYVPVSVPDNSNPSKPRAVKILTLCARGESQTFDVWASDIVSRTIDNFMEMQSDENKTNKNLFIKSLGKRPSQSNPTFKYFDVALKLY